MSKVRLRYNKFINVAEKSGFISPLVHIGQFKKDCKAVLEDFQLHSSSRKDLGVKEFSDAMGVDENTIKELEKECSPSLFNCPLEEEIFDWDNPFMFPEDHGLVTLHAWKKLQENRIDPVTLIRNRILKSKYTKFSCALHSQSSQIKAKSPEDVVTCPEVVVTVSVCFPWEIRSTKATGVEFYVLGSQKLTELRDRIPCVLDDQPLGDYADDTDYTSRPKIKDISFSSLFYIENTFYNDLRSPSTVDLSKDIVEWAKESVTPIPSKTTSVNMERCSFNDLKVRLGCPYVFLHHGQCEHLVVFKDIRLFSASDCQSRSSYPVAVSRAKVIGYSCQICDMHLSTWATRWDELAEGDPGLFCDRCFRVLHYDKEGNRLGNFAAFRKINIGELEV